MDMYCFGHDQEGQSGQHEEVTTIGEMYATKHCQSGCKWGEQL